MRRNLAALVMAAAVAAAPAWPQPAQTPPLPALPQADFAATAHAPVPASIPVVLLVDLSTGQELFAREAGRRFIPASVTKVMTAYTAFRLAEAGDLSLEMRYQISPELAEEWSGEGSTMFLQAGEQPTVGQLLLGVTTVSGNDASEALALAATGSRSGWLALMNANARDLGMADTHFGSPNGYPDGGTTYTTARDLVKLGRALTLDHPALYRRFFGHRQLTWRNITQPNHDPVTGQIEGGDGIKTGFTAEAGFTFLGSAERERRRLLVVLAGAPTASARDTAARALLEWGFDRFRPQTLLASGQVVGQARVQQGAARHVGLRLPRDLVAALPHGGGAATAEIAYHGPLVAPVAAGQEVARLRLRVDGVLVQEVPLEAASGVAAANVWQRLGNGLAGMLS